MTYAMRSLSFAALAASALFLFLPHPAAAATVTVNMTDNAFTPRDITINPGDTLVFVNKGALAHSATADSGAFDTGILNPGQSSAATFNSIGTYVYHCSLHGASGGVGMAGTIRVVAPGTTTTTSGGGTSASIEAQAQALLAQIAALQAQLAAGTRTGIPASSGTVVSSSACPLIGRTLKYGVEGDDVTRLQQFLAQDASVYPEAIVSGYYGALTQSAVQRWQAKYNIVSSGSPETTGYGQVGPRTAAAIALLCAQRGGGGGAAPQVGGYISVTPISGNAPLLVTVTATVNTTNSCAAAVYLLDFGDGTVPQQIPVSANLCKQTVQTLSHSYQYGGTFKIKLSAGGHETYATVVVAGPAAPAAPVNTPGLPAESFSVSPTTGGAPLTVTFSGVVNSNDKGFCAGGCASVLDFGDGKTAQVALPTTVGGWLNYSIQHTYTQTGGFKATLYQGGAGAGQPIVGSQTIVVTAGSTGGGSSTPSFTYSPPVVSLAGTDSYTFNIQYDLPSSCTGYDLLWGDGTAHEIQNDGGSSCTQQRVVRTSSHQYAGRGTYTIVLKRGASLSRTDDVSITISN